MTKGISRGGLVVVCCCAGGLRPCRLRRTPFFLVLNVRKSCFVVLCVDFCIGDRKKGAAAIVLITRNIVPGKEPVFHVICTPHQPVTTHFRCDSIEMINPSSLPIASGFMVFD